MNIMRISQTYLELRTSTSSSMLWMVTFISSHSCGHVYLFIAQSFILFGELCNELDMVNFIWEDLKEINSSVQLQSRVWSNSQFVIWVSTSTCIRSKFRVFKACAYFFVLSYFILIIKLMVHSMISIILHMFK